PLFLVTLLLVSLLLVALLLVFLLPRRPAAAAQRQTDQGQGEQSDCQFPQHVVTAWVQEPGNSGLGAQPKWASFDLSGSSACLVPASYRGRLAAPSRPSGSSAEPGE